MEVWLEQLTRLYFFLVLPSLILIIPFLVVFLSLKVASPYLNSVILFTICVLLECIWWFVVYVILSKVSPTSMLVTILLLMPIFPVIFLIILYVEIIGVTSPVKAASILTSLCGFFHAFGLWLAYCESEGGISADNVHLAIFFSAITGIFGAVVYLIVSGILHGTFFLIKGIYIEVKQG